MKLFRAYLDLGKFRLSALVVATTLAGYLLAQHGSTAGPLLWTLLGTLLSSLGANGLNQWYERERDAKMNRTRTRPIPSGRIDAPLALRLALGSAIAGVLLLALMVNLLTAALSLLTILLYVCIYTPMKATSPANTLVGAFVGAIPPLMGWSAATGTLGFGALALGAILFVWQIPHFLGLAWMYREDYAAGGFRMLPVVEPAGQMTGQLMMVYSFALIPVALLLTIGRVSGWVYGLGAVLLGIVMIVLAWRFYFERTHKRARAIFLASLAYLPVLLTLMIWNAAPAPRIYVKTHAEAPSLVQLAGTQPAVAAEQ